MFGTCNMNEGHEEFIKILVGMPEGKKLLWKPRRWYGPIERDFAQTQTGCDWLRLAQDQWRALVNMVMSLNVRKGVEFHVQWLRVSQ
jgi:hypothetical protein